MLFAVHRDRPIAVAFEQEKIAKFRTTDACGVLEHCVENRVELALRRTDDAQNLRRGRLLL